MYFSNRTRLMKRLSAQGGIALAGFAASLAFSATAHAQTVEGGTSTTTTEPVCNQNFVAESLACGTGASAPLQAPGVTGESVAVGVRAQATGSNAVAVGYSAEAGDRAVAVGNFAQSDTSSTALGDNTVALGGAATAIGSKAEVRATGGTAIGWNAEVNGTGALAGNVTIGAYSTDDGEGARDVVSVGNGNAAAGPVFTRAIINVSNGTLSATSSDAVTGQQLYQTNLDVAAAANLATTARTEAASAHDTANSAMSAALAAQTDAAQAVAKTAYVAVSGSGATPVVSGTGAVGIGVGQRASGNGAVAIGDPNTASGNGAVAIGANNTATGDGAVALGNNSIARGNGNVALGDGAQATGANSVALGGGSVATAANTVSIGAVGAERTLSNVAAGVNATDAVNLEQLTASSASTLTAANNYTDSRLAGISFDLHELRRDLRAAVAGSDAISSIPQNLQPGRVTMGVGMSQYGGSVGFAAGISTTTANGQGQFRLSVAGASRGGPVHVAGGAGFSF